jgi:putative oxidoreductase
MSEIALERPSGKTGTARTIGLWLVQIAAAGLFFFAGGSKLAGDAQMVQVFGVIGIGQWFRYLTGGLEVIGAAGLLFPATAGLAALMLAVVMIGAVLAHLFIIGGSPAMPAVLLLAMAVVAWARRAKELKS